MKDRADQDAGPRPPSLLDVLLSVLVLAFFVVGTLQNAPETFAATIGIAALAVTIDLVWKHMRPPAALPGGESQVASSPSA